MARRTRAGNSPEACRVPAERLLRIVFCDRRTRWDEIAILPRPNVWDRLAELRAVWRIFPGWVRWEALLAHAPLWSLRTNLWQLFGLPDDRRRLSAWIRAHR